MFQVSTIYKAFDEPYETLDRMQGPPEKTHAYAEIPEKTNTYAEIVNGPVEYMNGNATYMNGYAKKLNGEYMNGTAGGASVGKANGGYITDVSTHC